MNQPRRQGFTLIELLVAITMTSLLSLAGLYAMRAGFLALERTGKQLSFERKVLGTQRVLEQMIANMMPARAFCHGGTLDPTAPLPVAGGLPFFDGRRDAMRFVSSFSLNEAARGPAQIIELAVIPGRNNEGVRLIVNEHLYWGPRSTGYFCTPQRHTCSGQPAGLAVSAGAVLTRLLHPGRSLGVGGVPLSPARRRAALLSLAR